MVQHSLTWQQATLLKTFLDQIFQKEEDRDRNDHITYVTEQHSLEFLTKSPTQVVDTMAAKELSDITNMDNECEDSNDYSTEELLTKKSKMRNPPKHRYFLT